VAFLQQINDQVLPGFLLLGLSLLNTQAAGFELFLGSFSFFFSQFILLKMSGLIDFSQPSLYFTIAHILFNPIFWNTVARAGNTGKKNI
jgi:hypothetical protein